MFQHIKSILTLAILYLITAPTLLLVERGMANFSLPMAARQMVILSAVFFAFTLIELGVTSMLQEKDSAYQVGSNLGFSLLRLFMTFGILYFFRQQEDANFTIAVINVLVFYFITLLFSTWRRKKNTNK